MTKNRCRQQDSIVGYLIAPAGARIPVTALSIDTAPGWWGGRMRLARGEEIEPGRFHMAMHDGQCADLSVDEIRHWPFGVTIAIYHGFGPAPVWNARGA